MADAAEFYVRLKEIAPGLERVEGSARMPKWAAQQDASLVPAPPGFANGRMPEMLRWKGRWVQRDAFKKDGIEGRIGMRWHAPFLDGSGYAEASRNHAAALHRAGASLTLKAATFETARADYGSAGEIVRTLLNRGIPYAVNLVYMTPDFFPQYRETGCYNVGFFYWETDVLPEEWVVACRAMNEIWVPCRWTAEVCAKSGVDRPIRVFGGCANTAEYGDGATLTLPGLDPKWFKFYSVFQWTERKNPRGLLKAYLTGFKKSEPVVLIVKAYRASYSADEQNAVREEIKKIKREIGNEENQPRIMFVPYMMSKAEMVALHRLGDCFVMPHRSEGWGVPHFDALLMGKPVITTRYGGNMDFTLPEFTYLLDYKLIPVGGMDWIKWYRPHMKWAEPDVDECRYHMRYVFENRDEAKAKGRAGQAFVRDVFSWERVGQAMKSRLSEIWGGM